MVQSNTVQSNAVQSKTVQSKTVHSNTLPATGSAQASAPGASSYYGDDLLLIPVCDHCWRVNAAPGNGSLGASGGSGAGGARGSVVGADVIRAGVGAGAESESGLAGALGALGSPDVYGTGVSEVLGFVEQRAEFSFEVMKLGRSFTWTVFPTLDQALTYLWRGSRAALASKASGELSWVS